MHKNKPVRIYLTDEYYFVTSKTFFNQPIFQHNNLAEIFSGVVKFLNQRGDFELVAGVLLPDHFHFLLKPKKKNISEIMHDLKSYTAAKVSEKILLNNTEQLRGETYRQGAEGQSVRKGQDGERQDRERQGANAGGQGVEALPMMRGVNICYRNHHQHFQTLPPSSKRKTVSIKIWQSSFYYHIITSEADFVNHYNYIANNPYKHGYISDDKDWPWLWFDDGVNP